MNLFGVGLPEMAVILVVGLLIFGPRKLPEIGRTVAKTIKSLQTASKEFEAELRRETSNLDKPAPKPVAAIEATAEATTEAESPVEVTADDTEAAPKEAVASEIITDDVAEPVEATPASADITEPQTVA